MKKLWITLFLLPIFTNAQAIILPPPPPAIVNGVRSVKVVRVNPVLPIVLSPTMPQVERGSNIWCSGYYSPGYNVSLPYGGCVNLMPQSEITNQLILNLKLLENKLKELARLKGL